MRRYAGVIGAVVVTAWASTAAADSPSPAIRGLAPAEVEDLREGRGMGQARAAEANGYPGPRHVLDAARAGRVALRPEQLASVQRIFERMSADARRLGQQVLAEEQALEAAFRAGSITEPELDERLARIAGLRGALRAVHLRAHLETRRLLDEPQLRRYEALRGEPVGDHAEPHRHP